MEVGSAENKVARPFCTDDIVIDELFVLREPEVVEPFENKTFVPGPPDLLKNFEKHVESVPQFCERVKFQSPEDAQAALQGALLLSLEGDRKGMYSVFHDNAVEKYGYDHPESIRLAYMYVLFCPRLQSYTY
jgi:hypothetical protein